MKKDQTCRWRAFQRRSSQYREEERDFSKQHSSKVTLLLCFSKTSCLLQINLSISQLKHNPSQISTRKNREKNKVQIQKLKSFNSIALQRSPKRERMNKAGAVIYTVVKMTFHSNGRIVLVYWEQWESENVALFMYI